MPKVPILWKPDRSAKFKKMYRSKSAEIQKRIDEKIVLLLISEEPQRLGEKKGGLGFWGIDVAYDARIGYDVVFAERKIRFLKVCTHKELYGRN
jgi:mRNA-degrading endonuclease YafQ of YafQ-DinJ toxin-antitoxin module